MANAHFQGTGRDCLVRWRMLAVEVVEGGGEFGAECLFSGLETGLPSLVANVGCRGIGGERGVRCQMVVHAAFDC